MSATVISALPARTAFVDRKLPAGNGYVMLGIGLALIAVSCWLAYTGFVAGQSVVRAWIAVPAIICGIAVLKGLVVLQPKERLNKGLEHGLEVRRVRAPPGGVRDNWDLLGSYWASARFTGRIADTLRALARQ